ncbi:uridine diphosphate glucose pyrophosphatase-like [Dendronephthya gigantea]|uniref:uridine diphosphate glucose pyrophosphatase-like n=1 Tax=Dendronephthya gigantea TaxID=151771 RepID=UPI00106BBF0E|nr:uridine diphosphate glucose pyrophosphatase-like [Dendronephthya gigantea]
MKVIICQSRYCLFKTLKFIRFASVLVKNMEDLVVKDMKVVPCVNSKYVQPSRLQFNQNGVNREWDYINVHDSVAALLLNTTRNEFILVKQFRPAVYMRKNRQLNERDSDNTKINQESSSIAFIADVNEAVTYELCAGIVDKNIPLKSVMKEEILEECGYDVPESHIERVYSAWGSVGFAGTLQTLFFAEVTDDMKVNEGGGNRSEGEKIEVYYLPGGKVLDFLYNESLPKPPSLIAAFFWYLNTKKLK